jgi:uncharacterized protein (TIGR02246 family)
MDRPDDLSAALAQTEAAMQALVAGDAEPFLALWSQRDDVTVMGGFGGHLQGWEQIKQNTQMAASRFAGGRLEFERLAAGISADLAYAVWIERGHVRLSQKAGTTPLVVRVTHIYRREDGSWKVIHRHGDQVTENS